MEKLINKIKDGCSSSCLVLVPRRVSANRIRKTLVERLGFIFDLRILTIPEFLKSLRHLDNSGIKLVSDSVACEIIGQLARQKGSSSSFHRLLSRPSGQKLALNTLQALILAGLEPENLELCQKENISNIHTLLRDYLYFCESNSIADRALWQITMIKALERETSLNQDVSDFFVFDFNAVPAYLKRLFSILKESASVHFQIPCDPDRAEHFLANQTLSEEFSLGKDDWSLPYKINSPLQNIQQHLFNGTVDALTSSPDEISFHRSPGRFDEVEAAAVRIKELINDHGVLPSKIALSTRNLGIYNQYIEAVMQQLQLPYSYRRGTPMLHSPLIRLIMKLLECHGVKITFQRLLAILRSRFLPWQEHSLSWQKLVAGSGIYAESFDGWTSGLENYYSYSSDERRAENLKKSWIENKGDLLISRIKNIAQEILSIHQAESPLQQLELFCRDSLADLNTFEDKELWERHLEAFFKVLAKLRLNLETIKGVGLKPLQSELDQLREELKETTIHEKQYLDESVSVITTFDLGYLDVDHLFLVGMDEHTIPKASYASSTLLSDSDIYEIKEVGINNADEIPSSHSRRIAEEQAFILAVASASKTIDLYYPALGSDGKELSPSPYFAELLRLSGEPVVIEEPGGDSRTLLQSVPVTNSLRRQVVRHLYRTDIERSDPDTLEMMEQLNQLSGNKSFFQRIETLQKIENHRNNALMKQEPLSRWSGQISNLEVLHKLLGLENRDWSASALQTYSSCPFEFFLKYILGLKELELPGEEPDPRITGSLYHRILKTFVDSSTYPLNSFALSRETMQKAIETEMPQVFVKEGPLPPRTMLLLKKTEDVMERFLKYELAQNNGLPQSTEYSFNGQLCQLTLSDGKSVGLKGVFDRIDKLPPEAARDYLVIDYKLGSGKLKEPGAKTFARGANLQMPLYLIAASRLLDIPACKLQGRFISLSGNDHGNVNSVEKKWQVPLTREDKTTDDEKSLIEIIEDIIAGISAGHFPVETKDGSKVNNLTNLVGRWLELPPELAEDEE